MRKFALPLMAILLVLIDLLAVSMDVLHSPAHAASSSGDLFTVGFNPGPVVLQNCQSKSFDAYENAGPADTQLVAVDLWMGLYKDAYADITVEVYKIAADGSSERITSFRQDRYSNPSGEHQRFISFAPYHIRVAPGERIVVSALNCYVAGSASPLHPIVDLYFSQ
jgi:hypothetical protein